MLSYAHERQHMKSGKKKELIDKILNHVCSRCAETQTLEHSIAVRQTRLSILAMMTLDFLNRRPECDGNIFIRIEEE